MDGPRTAALAVTFALLLALSPAAALPLDAGASSSIPATVPVTQTGNDSASRLNATGLPITGQRNTTGYLAIPVSEIERTEFASAHIDAAGAATVDRAEIEGRYSYLTLVESFTAAGTTVEREAAVEVALARLENRVTAVERRDRRALAAFNGGEMSAGTYLRELAAVDARADELSRSLTQLYEHVDSMRDPPVSPARIAEMKTRLVGLRGPVRDRVAAAMRGESDPIRVFVETSDTGVVLATVTGSEFNRQYVREAYLPSARDPDGTDGFRTDRGYDLGAARERASELYPWTFENAGPTSTGLRTGEPYLYRAGVYSVTVDHPHGTATQGDLVVYIDGATGEVFREVQFKDLSEIPTGEPVVNRSAGLSVAVNRTHGGGPLSVDARSNATGEPVDATVFVDGARVGTTGSDGQLWTIAPREAYTVAVGAEGQGNVTVGPLLPERTT
jgi:hypothetical protein